METPSQRRSSRGGVPPPFPVRITRQQEKEDLSNLNDRLAAYIDKVRSLEAENDRLQEVITESESSFSHDLSGMKAAYETELADARKTLDQVAKEGARLQLELGRIREEHKELKARNIQKESELEAALVRLRDMEALLSSKDVALSAALGEKRRLEADVKDLKAQTAKLDGTVADAKKQLQDEMLRRVDAENRLQTLKEELDFQKNVHTEELQKTKRQYETRLVETDNRRKQEYDNQRANDLAELREEHEKQLRLYKEELERYYTSKLKDAQQSAERSSHLLRTTNEELQENQRKNLDLLAQLGQLQKQLTVSEVKVRDQEEAMTREHSRRRSQLEDKDEEISEIRARMQQQLDDYKELLDVKVALDTEISAFRKMMEGEEERLHLSPSPKSQQRMRTPGSGRTQTSHQFHSATASSSGIGTDSTKRRRLSYCDGDAMGGTVTETSISQHSSDGARINFNRIDPTGRFIRLSNETDEDQSLANWQLKRQVGNAAPIVYKFPPNFTLKAGATVTVWAASGGGTHNPPSDLVWQSQNSWGTGDLVQTILIGASGEEKAKKRDVTRTLFHDDEDEDMAAPSAGGGEVEYNLRSRMVLRNGGAESGDNL